MTPGRTLRLLLLALVVLTGLAEGVDHRGPVAPQQVSATVSAPRQSLPTPAHDEATCAFCQAAIFPPCAPQPAQVSLADEGELCRDRPAADAHNRHSTAHRPPSSRAPPALRIV